MSISMKSLVYGISHIVIERAARKAASDSLEAVREELAEERETKTKLAQQLEERKKKYASLYNRDGIIAYI